MQAEQILKILIKSSQCFSLPIQNYKAYTNINYFNKK